MLQIYHILFYLQILFLNFLQTFLTQRREDFSLRLFSPSV
jgi:hypothetical protein